MSSIRITDDPSEVCDVVIWRSGKPNDDDRRFLYGLAAHLNALHPDPVAALRMIAGRREAHIEQGRLNEITPRKEVGK